MLAATEQVNPSEGSQTDTYRLIVFNRAGTRVLLESGPSGYDLPHVDIPKFTRAAKEITSLIRCRLNIPSILLFTELFEQSPERVYSAAVQAQVLPCSLPKEMHWFPVHHTISHILKNRAQKALESSYLRFSSRVIGTDHEPFSRMGWFSRLQEWVREIIHPLGMELKDFQQLNGCETFSLVRFETTHKPVWFKAVGNPNLREYEITQRLSESLPKYFPTVIATKPEWHGWLMADVTGTSLRDDAGLEQWRCAVSTLASLQIDLRGKADWLVQIGCKDRRLAKILDEIDPFVDLMVELMRQQPKTPPPILSKAELLLLGQRLKDACFRLRQTEIEETLVHGDINPGNIWMTVSHDCIFLDWAEGYLGPPFVTFEHLMAYFRKMHRELVAWEQPLQKTYMEQWQTVLPPRRVSEALSLAPLVAVLSYALTRDWKNPQSLKEPNFAKHMRSLVRRMHGEALKLEEARH